MKKKFRNIEEFIKLDDYSKTPKYKQLVNNIIEAIENGDFKLNDRLPTVNTLLETFDISRDTIVKAYDILKENNIILSVPGRGYYINSDQISQRPKILLLFNKLSVHKKIIYDTFSSQLGENAVIDFYIYNNDFKLFKRILLEKLNENYTHFVIIPHFLEGGANAVELIKKIPIHKLIILDKKLAGLSGDYACVYQDFESDIFNALLGLKDRISNYKVIKLVFQSNTYQPVSSLDGFKKFCCEFAFSYQIVGDLGQSMVEKGDVYITVMEEELVTLIKKVKDMDLVIGKDIGVISYNDTVLKEILLDGITTISTDFELLGKTAAILVLENSKKQIANPFHFRLRNSL